MRITTFILLLAAAYTFTNCNALKKGLNKGLSDQNRKVVLDSLGKKLGKGIVSGATETLKSDTTAERMGIFIGNLTDSVTASTRVMMDSLFKNDVRIKKAVAGIIDTVQVSMDSLFYQLRERDLKNLMLSLNDQIRALPVAMVGNNLRESLIGQKAVDDMMVLRDSLLGATTRAMTKAFVKDILDEESTDQVRVAVRESLAPTIDKIFDRFDNSTERGLSFAQSNINQILLLVGAILAGLLVYYHYQKNRYTNLVKNMTFEIENMSDEEAQKQLKKNIRKKATEKSLEPLLRNILQKQGIVHRKSKQKET